MGTLKPVEIAQNLRNDQNFKSPKRDKLYDNERKEEEDKWD